MKRGTICWVNLEPSFPPEFGKTRPVLIISNSDQNLILGTVVVLPLSTKPPEIWPLRQRLILPRRKSSFVVLPGIRQVNKTRLLNVIGYASQETMTAIDVALDAYLKD